MNVYILYIDSPKSELYKNECIESLKKNSPGSSIIPVLGYNGTSYEDICKKYSIGIIPFYLNQMEANGKTLNRAFSCTAGHIDIWTMISQSGQSGIILEHDAICKGNLEAIQPQDNEILWLGPRIVNQADYATLSPDSEYNYEMVDRWEGTHAYAITPVTAKHLLKSIKKYGLNDSLDGQLGMRSMFDIPMRMLDPAPVVAVTGSRDSCIENNGVPATWNAYYGVQTQQRFNVTPPPLRQLFYDDNERGLWSRQVDVLNRELTPHEQYIRDILVVGDTNGYITNKLSNIFSTHDDSRLSVISDFKANQDQVLTFNSYFSKYYYKINIINSKANILQQCFDDPEIRYDLIYYRGSLYDKNEKQLYKLVLLWNLIKRGGFIVTDAKYTEIEMFQSAVNPITREFDNFYLFKKL